MKSQLLLAALFFTGILYGQNGTIRGNVVNPEGTAAANVNISLLELQKGTVSGDDGYFEINNLPAGSYTIKASYTGYKTLEQKIRIEEEKTLVLGLQLFVNSRELKEIIIKGYQSLNNRYVRAGKAGIKAFDLPQSLHVIDRQTLENQQVQNMQEVLANANGVYIMGNTGGYQEEIAGRGFAYRSDNTFKNGARYNNGMMMELSGVERIEFIKGSAALLYGNVAAGGIMNIVTKKPKFKTGGELSFRTGSFGLIKPSFDLFGKIGKGEKAAFRLDGSYQKANSFRQYVHSERVYLNPSFLFRLNKKTEILLEADYIKDDRTPDFGTGIVNYAVLDDYPRNRFLGVPWGYFKGDQLTTAVTVNHKLNEKWKINLAGTYRDYSSQLFSTTRPNTGGNLIKEDGNWIRNLQRNANSESYYILEANLTGELTTGKINHHLLVGFDTDHMQEVSTSYNRYNNYDTVNIFHDLPADVRSDIPVLNKSSINRSPMNRAGVYIQDLVDLLPKFKLLAGIRYSYLDIRTANKTISSGAVSTSVSFEDAFSPRLGLVFQPTGNNAVFASYSSSFSPNTGIDTLGNSLPPSVIDQYEFGFKNELFDNRASVNITFYLINNNNLAQVSLANGNTNNNIKELAGSLRSKGAELDITAQPVPGLNITAGYSYNETRYVKSNTYVEGSLLRYNPAHTANLGAYYRFLNGRLKGLSFGLTNVYIGTRYAGRSTRVRVTNDVYRIIKLPDYYQLDATIAYRIHKFEMRAKLGNITNVLSYNVHDDNSVNPVAPRNFSFSAAFRF